MSVTGACGWVFPVFCIHELLDVLKFFWWGWVSHVFICLVQVSYSPELHDVLKFMGVSQVSYMFFGASVAGVSQP